VDQRRKELQEESNSLEARRDALAERRVPKLENRLDLTHARVSLLVRSERRKDRVVVVVVVVRYHGWLGGVPNRGF